MRVCERDSPRVEDLSDIFWLQKEVIFRVKLFEGLNEEAVSATPVLPYDLTLSNNVCILT